MTKSWGLPSYGAPLLGVRQRQGLQVKSERNAEGQRGPTVLLEIEGSGLLTDPTFDPVGGYIFGWGAGRRDPGQTRRPARSADRTARLLQTWFAIGPSR
jgi:hypothetical protein